MPRAGSSPSGWRRGARADHGGAPMPRIYRFECDLCPLKLPSGWGRSTYAVGPDGSRTICAHPGELYEVTEITGLDWDEAVAQGRAGVQRDCLCRTCLRQFTLDYERDARVCPGCGGTDVRSTEELVGGACPRCGAGSIVQIDTGLIC